MRGPPPKPTKLRVLQGNPGRKPIRKREPEPRVGTPQCPAWLKGEARKCWQRNAPKLIELGLLTELDEDEFTRYCISHAQRVAAVKWLEEHGTVYPIRDEKTGRIRYLQQVPQVSIARNAAKLASVLGAKFGLSPADRTRIQVPEKTVSDDDLEHLLGS